MSKVIRTGAIGAMLDEYERAIAELIKVIISVPDNALTIITDPTTTDENCRSLQNILSHVVSAAYGYATNIHNLKGHNAMRPDKTFHLTIQEYIEDLNAAFAYTENVFREIKESEVEQHDNALKIKSVWGQIYDIEQMMEHAIVHILRHRRQIERLNLHEKT